jgi:hypothetical protein
MIDPDRYAGLLEEKNRKYGNAVFSVKNIFCKDSALDQLKTVIDDKLTRVANIEDQTSAEFKDCVFDLIGYFTYMIIHTTHGGPPLTEGEVSSHTKRILREICYVLDQKRSVYGDSITNPKKNISQTERLALLKLRIDHKLSRIQSVQSDEDENPIHDLLGMLLILHHELETTCSSS